MKTTIKLLAMTMLFGAASPLALAADVKAGKKVFDSNCSGCHSNGSNVMVPEKNLKKSALEKNGLYSERAIITQVTNGKSPMPAFGKQLSSAEIESVAAYVMKQANADWK